MIVLFVKWSFNNNMFFVNTGAHQQGLKPVLNIESYKLRERLIA